ncbi:MAG: DnaJ domain-containing protein [Gammaproteobacteria bacterium]
MENRRNYYRILHVQPDAPEEIIRSSYRTLMTKLRHHPDLGGDHFTATMINEAYAVLSDPDKRAAYDDAWQAVLAGIADAHHGATHTGTQDERATEAGQHRRQTTASAEPPAVCQFCGAAHGFAGRIHGSATCTTCNTPLAPAIHDRLEPGQRAVSRIRRRLPISYFTGWPAKGPYPGELRDLSLHGLQFATQAAMPIGKLLKVDCEALVALVRVVACNESNERDWRWLIRGEYSTVRFRRPRGGFVATRV